MSIKYLFGLEEINQYQGSQYKDFQFIKPSDPKLVKNTTHVKIAIVNKKHGFRWLARSSVGSSCCLDNSFTNSRPLCFTSYRECVSHAWTRLYSGVENISLYMEPLNDEWDHRWLSANSELGVKLFAQSSWSTQGRKPICFH